MTERENVTLAWRILFTGSRASLLKRASPGPPTRLPDKRDLKDLEEDFRELGIPMKCLPFDESIHLSSVFPGAVELVWPDRPARSALYTDLKSFFHKARPDTVTKRLIGAVMMYCLPPSTTNLQHISMDVEPIAMFADPDFNPDLWQLRREVLKHQKKSFNSPPLPTQIFQPDATHDVLSSSHAPRPIKRESPADAGPAFGYSSNQDPLMQQRPRTPTGKPLNSSFDPPHSPTTLLGSATRRMDSDAMNSIYTRGTSPIGGHNHFERHARVAGSIGGSRSGQLDDATVLSGTRDSPTLIPRKRTLSDASALQRQRRPSHASALDQDRDGDYTRRGSYTSDMLRDLGDRRSGTEQGGTRALERLGGHDQDSHTRADRTYKRARDGSPSYRRRDSDSAIAVSAMDDGTVNHRGLLDDARMANGRLDEPFVSRRMDTLDRILASPSFAQMDLDVDLPPQSRTSPHETPAPESKLSNLDIMALKAKLPRIEAERDAARARARELERTIDMSRRGAGRERELENEVASWRTRAEDAVYRSNMLADRLKRLLAGELPDGLNPDADEALTLLGHVLDRMRRDIAQAEAERSRYDLLSRELETLVAHRDTIPPLIEALQQIADATKNIKLP